MVEADLGEGGSSFVEVYVPTTDFDAILDDPGDQLLLGDFNVPHPAWFSRTGDERTAARGEAVHGAINSLQLATLIRPLVSSAKGQPSPPDVILLSGHLLPDGTWSTHTTLGSDHLPVTISLFIHAQPSPRIARSYANFRIAEWKRFTAENRRDPLYHFSTLPGKKSSDIFSATPEDTMHINCAYIRDYCGLSPMYFGPRSQRVISSAKTTQATLPFCCWSGTSSGTICRRRKISEGIFLNPATTPPTRTF